jgi:hypothetical protein
MLTVGRSEPGSGPRWSSRLQRDDKISSNAAVRVWRGPIVDVAIASEDGVQIHRQGLRHRRAWLLKGLVKCGVCGVGTNCQKMRGRNGTWHRYYRCRNHDPIAEKHGAGADD